MERVIHNSNLCFEIRFRYSDKTCVLLLRALRNARDSKEAISVIKELYNRGAVYRYYDFSQCAQDDREALYKTIQKLDKQYIAS